MDKKTHDAMVAKTLKGVTKLGFAIGLEASDVLAEVKRTRLAIDPAPRVMKLKRKYTSKV